MSTSDEAYVPERFTEDKILAIADAAYISIANIAESRFAGSGDYIDLADDGPWDAMVGDKPLFPQSEPATVLGTTFNVITAYDQPYQKIRRVYPKDVRGRVVFLRKYMYELLFVVDAKSSSNPAKRSISLPIYYGFNDDARVEVLSGGTADHKREMLQRFEMIPSVYHWTYGVRWTVALRTRRDGAATVVCTTPSGVRSLLRHREKQTAKRRAALRHFVQESWRTVATFGEEELQTLVTMHLRGALVCEWLDLQVTIRPSDADVARVKAAKEERARLHASGDDLRVVRDT